MAQEMEAAPAPDAVCHVELGVAIAVSVQPVRESLADVPAADADVPAADAVG